MSWILQWSEVKEAEMYIEMMMERVMNVTKCLDMYENCSWCSAFSFSRIVLGAMEFWKHFFEETALVKHMYAKSPGQRL